MSLRECLTHEALSDWISHRLTPVERERYELHLADCAACRHRLASFYESAQDEGTPSRAPYWLKAQARQIPYRGAFNQRLSLWKAWHPIGTIGAAACALMISLSCLVFLNQEQSKSAMQPDRILGQGEKADVGLPREEKMVVVQAPDAAESQRRATPSTPAGAPTRHKPQQIDKLSAAKVGRPQMKESSAAVERRSADSLALEASSKEKAPPAAQPDIKSAVAPGAGRRVDSEPVSAGRQNAPMAGPSEAKQGVAGQDRASGALAGNVQAKDILADEKQAERSRDFSTASRPSAKTATQSKLRKEGFYTSPPAPHPPQLLQPAPDAVLAAASTEFRWTGNSLVYPYTLVLVDRLGIVLFQASTSQDRLTIHRDTLNIERGQLYFWHVEIRMPNGEIIKSKQYRIIFAKDPG